MIAECLEKRIDEIITLPEALRRTGIIENAPVKDIPPCSMVRPELDFLYKMARKFGGPVIEFGAYAGGSAQAFYHGVHACELPQPIMGRTVVSVDVYHRWEIPEGEFSELEQITENSRGYTWPYHHPAMIGFEDADHTRITTKAGLEQLKKAGCRILLVHDVDEEKLREAPMEMHQTSRAGALEFFTEEPEFKLIEVKCVQGLFIGIKRPLEF